MTGDISDGYHTFDELYMHRAALLVTLMMLRPDIAWMSMLHDDGSSVPGFFLAGLTVPRFGQISYHVRRDGPWWNLLVNGGITPRDHAPQWDGHTPSDVILRLVQWNEWMASR